MQSVNNFKFSWPFLGNTHIINFLQTNITHNNLSHFYIFSGARDLGKSTIARYFIQSILCENFSGGNGNLPCNNCITCRQIQSDRYSDILQISINEGRQNISVEQIREFIKAMNMGALSGKYKIGLIKDAHRLSMEAANALLKTLEEPKQNVIIILITDILEALPETIVSRAQLLQFTLANTSNIHDYLITEHKAGRDQAKLISRLCLGRPALAVKLLHNKEFFQIRYRIAEMLLEVMSSSVYKKFLLIDDVLKIADKDNKVSTTSEILDIWQMILRDMMLTNVNAQSLMTLDHLQKNNQSFNIAMGKLSHMYAILEEGKKYLAANVAPRLVLENISLQF